MKIKHINKIEVKLIEMLESDILEPVFEVANLIKLGIHHKIRFEKVEDRLEKIIKDDSKSMEIRVE